ncbi:MAG: lamin tail domain-containing protein, partial [Candidatus Nealsonbacteria bacterium]
NWEPYVTPFGISEEYKKQVKEELSNTIIAALKISTVAGEKFKPSLVDRLYNQLEKLKNEVTALIFQINPFKAGVALNLSEDWVEDDPPPDPQPIEAGPFGEVEIIKQDVPEEIIEPEIESAENSSPRAEEILAREGLLATTTELIIPESTTTIGSSASTTELVPLPKPESPPVPAPKLASAPGLVFCERDSGNPKRFRVLINEVAWMGTVNSPNNEWIELKNVWGIPVNLNGWQLLDKDRQIKIIFDEEDIIPAGGYYLLERTDDNSMPDAKADLIYTGALSNTDEALYLFDDQCNIEDEVLANPNWPAGDNLLKKPMARLDVLDWYAGVSTPGSENSSPPVVRSSGSAPAPLPTPSSSFTSPQIFITETYIGSEGDQKNDFVELYNPNSEVINLTDYYIQRKTENAQDFSTYVSHELLAEKIIKPQDYFLIANASSTFTTSADVVTTYPLTKNNTLVLKDPKQEIIDQVFTDNPPAGKSYGRKWSSTTQNYKEDFEIQIPTPRAQNQNLIVGEDESDKEEAGNDLLSVKINEIAWAGTKANSFDEWIELYNNTTSSIDIDGWRLNSSEADGINITFSTSTSAITTIPAQEFYLIERTDDSAVSDVSADWTGSFSNGLSNTKCEILYLYDSSGNLIDETVCSGNNWPGGEASPNYISMERITNASGVDSQNWASNNLVAKNGLDADGNLINGTPGAENSVAKSFTEIVGGLKIAEDFTLTLIGSPYLVEGSITVGEGAKLTIEPGVIIKFKHRSDWKSALNVEGALEAIGGDDPEQKITFTSFYDATGTIPVAGDWEWLYFKNAQVKLDNVIIKYAGKREGNPPFSSSFTRGALYVDGGNIEISNSKIEESQTLGIWLVNSALATIDGVEFSNLTGDWEKAAAIYIESGSPAISSSTFTDNNIGILVENFASPIIENNIFNNNQIPVQINTLLPTISNNTFNNNSYNGIHVIGLSLPEGQTSMVWKEVGVPYIINTLTLAPGLALQIEPGVVIKFLNNSRLNIEGSFEAKGNAGNKIVFTSIQDDEYGGDTNNDGAATQPVAGRWHYVYFAPSSQNPVLEDVIVRYGGWYNVFQGGAAAKSGAVKVDGTTLTIKDSLFESNLYAGLELINATTTLKNVVFNKNEHGIYIEAGDCPDLLKVEFGSGENANSANVFPSSCAP